APRGLCAIRIGGWSPRELHDHEADEVDRDRAEGVRLAYVAATRARDLLVVPALGDEPWEGGWLSPLNRALYPPPAGRRSPPGRPWPAARRPERPGFQVEGPRVSAAERGTGGSGDRRARTARVRRGRLFRRVVGSRPRRRTRARRQAAVRRAPRRADRQGRS